MDYFLLYPDEILRFLSKGGIIAWGIVPTADFTEKESLEDLNSKLNKGLDRLYEWGLDPAMIRERSILTPACGMGSMEEASADKVLDLLFRFSKELTDLK
jgi:hypothetical protein